MIVVSMSDVVMSLYVDSDIVMTRRWRRSPGVLSVVLVKIDSDCRSGRLRREECSHSSINLFNILPVASVHYVILDPFLSVLSVCLLEAGV